jgi:hypothetical protein
LLLYGVIEPLLCFHNFFTPTFIILSYFFS